MALRHAFDRFDEKDLGEDARKVIPRLPQPQVLPFRAGEDVYAMARNVAGMRLVTVDAAPGAGKTVDFPSGLVKGGASLVVHVMPARQLVYCSYKYISSLKKDVDIHLVDKFSADVEFPRKGLVMTSANVMVSYMALWHGRGDSSYSFVEYLDEVHESDAGMAVLRELKTSAPGVSQFVQATATMGSGELGTPFRVLVTKGELRELTFGVTDPGRWDMAASGVPWSMKNLRGDFLIFVDDDVAAEVITRKFEGEGIQCHRYTSATDPEKFDTEKRQIEAMSAKGGGISAFLLDNSYRSGHTFPSIARIIDMGQVKCLRPGPSNTVETYFRYMTLSESTQGKSRGARISGTQVDYWRPEEEPKRTAVLLTGFEADVACIFYRMLGFQPPKYLEGTPTYGGSVPTRLMAIMSGVEPVRRYYGNKDKLVVWPGNPPVVEEVAYQSPPSLESTPTPSRPASWSADSTASDAVQSALEKLTAGSSGKESQPVRRADTVGLEEEDHPFARFSRAYSSVVKMVPAGGGVEFGEYCYVAGAELAGPSSALLFPRGYDDLWGVIEGFTPKEYASSLDPYTRPPAVRVLLDAYNGSVALARATKIVLDGAAQYVDKGQVDAYAVQEWAGKVHKAWMRADVRMKSSYGYLRACARKDMRAVANMSELETEMVKAMLALLKPTMAHGRDESESYVKELARASNTWSNMSGTYKVEWEVAGLRERLGARLMGKPPSATVLFEAPKEAVGAVAW